MLSHDYVSRSMGILTCSKDKITDDECTTIIRTNGSFQIFINFSRYDQLLSSLQNLCVCKSLLYLDISYTKVLDIQFLSGCTHMKGMIVGTYKYIWNDVILKYVCYIRIFIHMYICIYLYVYIYIFAYTYICIRICICLYRFCDSCFFLMHECVYMSFEHAYIC
jgi:hypothetical protein